MNQSQKIRNLYAKGATHGQIAKKLGIRYQTAWRTTHRKFKGIVPADQRILKETQEVPTTQE
jgi:hypothetical protein